MPGDVGGGNDAKDIADLDHRQTVHAQNGFEQRAEVDVAHRAVGIDRDRPAFDARIEDVVDVEILREQIDHLNQRRIVEIQSAGNRGGRSGPGLGRRQAAAAPRGGGCCACAETCGQDASCS